MPLVVDTNSYLSLEDADSYFDDRLYSSDWTGATEGDKAKSLVMAAGYVDRLEFVGTITSTTQAMAWPREGVTDQDGRTIASDTVPQAVKDAQCEIALALLRDDLTSDDGQRNVRRLQAGSVQLEYDGRAPVRVVPDAAMVLLKPFLADGFGGSSVRLVP